MDNEYKFTILTTIFALVLSQEEYTVNEIIDMMEHMTSVNGVEIFVDKVISVEKTKGDV